MANYSLPSTVNVTNFISVRPSLEDDQRSTRYSIWKEQMTCLLKSQDLLGFIDGQIPIPLLVEESQEEQKLWTRTDMLIKGWILGSIGEDAIAAVLRLDSSREVWLKLENVFNQIQDGNNQIQNQMSDSSSNPGAEGEAAAAAAVGGRGIQNTMAGDDDRIVELQSDKTNNVPQQNNGARKDYKKYLELRRVITRGDWSKARMLLGSDKEARTEIISEINETALLIAVTKGKMSNDFVKWLLESMPDDALAIKNSYGNTALHRVAMIGNIETARMLLARNMELLYILNNQEYLPVHVAAIYCQKGMLKCLIRFHEQHARERPSGEHIDRSPFVGQLGASLLLGVIISQFIDVALNLVQNYPDLVKLKNQSGTDALYELARLNSAFESGVNFSWWQNWIYSRIVLTSKTEDDVDDTENLNSNGEATNQFIENLSSNDEATKKFGWFEIIYKIPFVKSIKDKKVMHRQALKLVKCVCKSLESLPSGDALPIYERALSLAAQNSIREVVEVIMDMFPTAINIADTKNEGNIFHVAARERSENVFNLLHQMKEGKNFFYNCIDSSGNNYMHMCGEQAPTHKLNLVSGAALQMQRELQWFKEMENFVTPSRRTSENNDGKTPYMLFTEKHQELKSQGEKWMKDTATSCTIAAALIATVVFAAPFTVPGGVNNDNGIPIFVEKAWFIMFAISDSISLFSSATSLLMFLSILTSRYAEEDFLYVLPTRLCFGLLTLFTSMIFMMIAFSSAIYITLRHKMKLFLIPILIVFACFPVASFVFSQFPLLIDAMYKTYGPGIFGKKRAHTLY